MYEPEEGDIISWTRSGTISDDDKWYNPSSKCKKDHDGKPKKGQCTLPGVIPYDATPLQRAGVKIM